MDFYDFTPLLVFVSIEKIYQTLQTVFHHISKHLEFRLNSPLSIWKLDKTLSLVFDILQLLFHETETCISNEGTEEVLD